MGAETTARRREEIPMEKIYLYDMMAEIEETSDTPRLREYFAHLEKKTALPGLGRTWKDSILPRKILFAVHAI